MCICIAYVIESVHFVLCYSKALTLIAHIIETIVATGFKLGVDILQSFLYTTCVGVVIDHNYETVY